MPKSQHNTLISKDKFDRVKMQKNCEQFILLKLDYGSRFIDDKMDIGTSISLVLKYNGYWYHRREELQLTRTLDGIESSYSTKYYRTAYSNQVKYANGKELLIPMSEFLLNDSMSINKMMKVTAIVDISVKVSDEPS